MVELQSLEGLSADQLREMAARLMTQLRHQGALLEKLTHENALLKRMKFAAQSERFNPEQKSLLEDEIEADLAAWPARSTRCSRSSQRRPRKRRSSPSVCRCPRTCPGVRSATSLNPAPADAAAR